MIEGTTIMKPYLTRLLFVTSFTLNCLAAVYIYCLEPSIASTADAPAPLAYTAFRSTLLPAGMQIELPIQPFGDRTKFEAIAYSAPNAWNSFNEYPIAGRILPIVSDTARNLLDSAPRIRPTVDGVITLLQWYATCQWTYCAGAFLNLARPSLDEVKDSGANIAFYCNDLVSTFRTLLLAQGIMTRSVFFEFRDSYGGGSHTFTEVWVEDLQKWIYADPFYKSYAKKSVAELIREESIKSIIRLPVADGDLSVQSNAQRDRELEKTFREGWASWSIPNGLSGLRMVYLDPAHYGENLLARPDRFGPFKTDIRY